MQKTNEKVDKPSKKDVQDPQKGAAENKTTDNRSKSHASNRQDEEEIGDQPIGHRHGGPSGQTKGGDDQRGEMEKHGKTTNTFDAQSPNSRANQATSEEDQSNKHARGR